jgi:Fe-S cluster assembly protein SufD
MSVAELALPQFKGRPGWEFTDLSGFDPAAFSEPDPEYVAPEPLFTGVTELRQTAEDAGEGVAVEDGPVVLPLSVARERHPELVEPHLGTVVAADDPFVEWAGEADGAFVWIPRNVQVEEPLLLSALVSSTLQRRVLIVVEDNASVDIFEQFTGDGLLNVVTEIVVGQNARLTYVCGQNLSERSFIFGQQRARVERDGYLDWVAVGFGGASGRVRMDTVLAGQGAEGRVTGAYAPHGRQHVDYDTSQEHAAPNTLSDLAFRGILSDRSSAVWKGIIKVDRDAQETDAFQECRNLLVSKRAHADAIPGLEILADNVRCTHAAAVAPIDPEQLFYLHSRGLPDDVAKRLVIEGFLSELVGRLGEGPVRESVGAALERRLEEVLG